MTCQDIEPAKRTGRVVQANLLEAESYDSWVADSRQRTSGGVITGPQWLSSRGRYGQPWRTLRSRVPWFVVQLDCDDSRDMTPVSAFKLQMSFMGYKFMQNFEYVTNQYRGIKQTQLFWMESRGSNRTVAHHPQPHTSQLPLCE